MIYFSLVQWDAIGKSHEPQEFSVWVIFLEIHISQKGKPREKSLG